MASKNHIVKRAGHTEEYDSRKLYASVYSAALAVREPSATAELIADDVCKEADKWLKNKHEVTSADIKRKAHDTLKLLNPDAAYIYLHQRNVS